MRPSEVESPMWTTDRQEVCGVRPAAATVLAAEVAEADGPADPPGLAGGTAPRPGAARPDAAVCPADAAGMAPASATVAKTATYTDIARATQPRRAAACRVPARSCARQRPIAPRRIG